MQCTLKSNKYFRDLSFKWCIKLIDGVDVDYATLCTSTSVRMRPYSLKLERRLFILLDRAPLDKLFKQSHEEMIVQGKCDYCGMNQDWKHGNNDNALWNNKAFFFESAAVIFDA
eukprot:scaffold2291_cov211-Alexandrium_tamarense.AAC.12